MRRCMLATAMLCLFSVSVQSPAIAEEKQTLAWTCPELTALLYVRKSAAPAPMSGTRFNAEHGVLRSHLTETGNWGVAPGWQFSEGEFVLRVASVVSGKAVAKSKTWDATFDQTTTPSALQSVPDILTAEYSVKATEGDFTTIHVKATGDDAEAENNFTNRRCGPLTIEMDAVFDTAKGWLHGVKGSWKGTGLRGDVSVDFEYALERVKSFADRAALDKAVETAIDKGLEAMDAREDDYRRGDYAAFAAYTYLQSGRGANNKFTALALSRMVKEGSVLKYIQTYHAASMVLALEAKYITDEERRQVAKGQRPGAIKRVMSEADKAAIKDAIDYIARGQANDAPGLFSYGETIGAGQKPDLSNTQFAALALAAAARCEVEIPVGIVRDMGNGLVNFQQKEGPEVWRVKGRTKRGAWDRERYPDQARGFAYGGMAGGVGSAYGSMTGAGTCSLLLLLDIYESWPSERQKKELAASQAKQWQVSVQKNADFGMAWLEHNYSVSDNPGHAAGEFFYYLYALERVGAFAPTEFIGEHEWYTEGALTLLLRQNDKGGWGKIEETCFALLFLGRATTPTRRRVITGK
ncbi:MAG: hypothetical protein IPK87_08285 [Planctomycetes bacterium]|nr:hypothetical protein [Planctomycetota bacterium]